MTDPQLLKTFLAVASSLSFRQAARELHYAPSSVSSRIRALEEELGVPLFERTGREVLLTEQGRRLVGHARRLVELAGRTRQIVTADPGDTPELTVRLSETLGIHVLPRILPAFRRRFPEVLVRFVTQSRHGLVRDLRHGLTDLALHVGEPFRAAGVVVEILHREALAVVVPGKGRLASLPAVGPEDLHGVALFLTPHVWSARRFIEEALIEAGVATSGLVECSSLEIVKRCVMAGQGVTVAPRFAVEREAAEGSLAAVPWSRGELGVPVLLARNADQPLSPPAEALVAATREVLCPSLAPPHQGLCPWTPPGA